MQLILHVQSYRGVVPAVAMTAAIGECGGTIGRAAGSDLVLDDPGKTVSRMHARVDKRGGRFYFADAGSNPSLINGQSIGNGRQTVLAEGDELLIGEYLVKVQMPADAGGSHDAPRAAAELFSPPPTASGASVPLFEPLPASYRGLAAEPGADWHEMRLGPVMGIASHATSSGMMLADPLVTEDIVHSASFETRLTPADDPLGLNLSGAVGAASRPTIGSLGARLAVPDFLGSASDHASPEIHSLSRVAVPFFPVTAIPDGYDLLADYLPDTAPVDGAAAAANVAALKMPGKVEIFRIRRDRKSRLSTILPPNDAITAVEQVFDRVIESDMVLPNFPVVATPAMTGRVIVAAKAAEATQAAEITGIAELDATTRTAGIAAMSPLPSAASINDPVVRALLRGLGVPDLVTSRPVGELAYLAGAMLRESTSGTMAMLTARALTKHENRIDVTMIGPGSNNPLKFFPDSESALTELLGAGTAGYMKPGRAFGNAFDDLKTHELAVLAGMRAALSAVLRRFDPAAIEKRLDEPGVFDRVLSSNRKAAMWDQLVALHAEIARDADDDFQRLFGEPFAHAYQAQIDRLEPDASFEASTRQPSITF